MKSIVTLSLLFSLFLGLSGHVSAEESQSFSDCLANEAQSLDQCVDLQVAPVANFIASIIFSEIQLIES